MKATNEAVIESKIPYTAALDARDLIMYDPETGLVAQALTVKKYVLSLFGAQSPKYKEVNALTFRNINRKRK